MRARMSFDGEVHLLMDPSDFPATKRRSSPRSSQDQRKLKASFVKSSYSQRSVIRPNRVHIFAPRLLFTSSDFARLGVIYHFRCLRPSLRVLYSIPSYKQTSIKNVCVTPSCETRQRLPVAISAVRTRLWRWLMWHAQADEAV